MTDPVTKPAVTQMEMAVDKFVHFLRYQPEKLSEFYNAIDEMRRRGRYLEIALLEARAEIKQLEDAICIKSIPSPTAKSSMIDCDRFVTFDWKMESIYWRSLIPLGLTRDESILRRMKLVAWREILKLFRAEFERCFACNRYFDSLLPKAKDDS